MRQLATLCATILVNQWARLVHFSFPEKYVWKWKAAMLSGTYEPETTSLFKEILRPGMTFVDIGAHIGYFSRLAARHVGGSGLVYAFEPDAENRAYLSKNVAQYGNVAVRSEAVSNQSGAIAFYHLENSTGCHSTIAPRSSAPSQEIQATRLDDFAEQSGIGNFDVIKMDIEGGEWNALHGMEKILSKKDLHLVMEYNPIALSRAGVEPDTVLNFLSQKGFSIFALSKKRMLLEKPFAASAKKYLSTDGSVNLYIHRV